MKFLFDLNHPAHVHFFRHPMQLLRNQGHEIIITSRIKEMAVPMLDELGIEHILLSAHQQKGMVGLAYELIQRDIALYRVVREKKPAVLAAIGGTFVAHVGWITRTPSLVFYDTENAKLQNAITYPFAAKVVVPNCYQSWTPVGRTIRYPGYHELSYLHPKRFSPDRVLAERNGLDPFRENFFIRTVSWQANHDAGETGWSMELLRHLIQWLSRWGKIHISSETPLPPDLAPHAYHGRVSEVHHLLAYCRLFIGESATMASECAVLGVPSIYAAQTGRGYTDEQETRYGLVINLRKFDGARLKSTIETVLTEPASKYIERRAQLLAESIDVAQFVAIQIQSSAQRKLCAV
jgi:predicted glycosyltransferase